MNNVISKCVVLLYPILLIACSTTHEYKNFTPQTAEIDQATIYIYRPMAMANAAYSPGMYVDGQFKFFIKNKGNTLLVLTPGEHVFEIEPDKHYSGRTRQMINMTVSKTYYLRIDSALSLKDSTQYEPYQRSFSLVEVVTSSAVNEIALCCNSDQTTKNSSAEIKSADEEPATGFSVNKTQNPFSH